MAGYEVARGFLSIVPSFRGAQQALTEGMIGPLSSQAPGLGQKIGGMFGGGFTKSAGLGGAAATASLASAINPTPIGNAGHRAGRVLHSKMMAALAPAAIGAGLAGAFKGLSSLGGEFDEAFDAIRTGTGATGRSLEGLKDSFRSVVSQVPADFASAGSVIADLNTTLGYTGSELETVSRQVLELGHVTGTNVSIRDLSAALNGFAIPASGASRALDDLFRVSQATGVPVNELSAKLSSQGAILREVGFSLTDSASLFGVLSKAGLNADQVLRSIGPGLVRLAKDGQAPREAFAGIVEEIGRFLKAGDKAGALNAAGEIFGTRGAGQFVAALEAGKISLEDMAAAAGLSGDTILQAAEQTKSFAEHWQTVKNNAKLALEPLAGAVFEGLSSTLAAALPILQGLSDWAREHPALARGVGAAIGVAAAAMAVAVPIVWAMNAALLANPITWIIAGIMAAIGALVLAYNKCEWFRNAVEAWFSVVGEIFSTVLEVAKTVWEGISSAVSQAWEEIGPTVTNAATNVYNTITSILQSLSAAWATIWEGIKGTASAVWSGIEAYIDSTVRSIQSIIQIVTGIISGDWASVWEGIKNLASAVWDGIKGIIEAGMDTARSILDNALTAINGLWQAAWGRVKDFLASSFNQMKQAVADGIGGVVDFVSQLPSRLLQTIGNLGGLLVNSGRSLVDGFLSGIKSAWGRLTGWVQSGMESLRGLWPFSPAKTGPFSGRGWVLYSGLSIGRAFAAGIEQSFDSAVLAAREGMSSVQDQLTGTLTPHFSPRFGLSGAYGATAEPAYGAAPRGIVINQHIQSATVEPASKLASQGAAAARAWRAL